jgi:hypothetical protein
MESAEGFTELVLSEGFEDYENGQTQVSAITLVESRDAAIRAECAERFVKAYRKDRISDETPAETEALRYYCAAIMAEPKEAV